MKNLQTLLKEYITENNITVYSLAARSGINRTTLQKALSGDRTLSKENFERLLPFFHLTPYQKDELEAAFLIEQIGKDNYSCSMEIKTLLECFSVPKFNKIDLSPFSGNPSSETVFFGRHQILNQIAHLMQHCHNHSHGGELRIYGSFDSNIWNDLYLLLRQFIHTKFPDLQIVHIVPLLTDNSSQAPYNIHVLGNILPYVFSDINNLHIHCYYEQYTVNEYASPFPYYIMCDNCLFLISKDFEEALYLHLPSDNRYMRGFEQLRRSSYLLRCNSFNHPDAINEIIQSDISDSVYFVGSNPPAIHTQELSLSGIYALYDQKAIANPNPNITYKLIKKDRFQPNRSLSFFTSGNADIHFLYHADSKIYHCCSVTEASISKALVDFLTNLEELNLASLL